MKEATEQTGPKEPIQQSRIREPSGTFRWTVVVLLIVAALIILLPMPDVTQNRSTARIILATIVMAICGIAAIWYKPTD
jgi:hypothetical protein